MMTGENGQSLVTVRPFSFHGELRDEAEAEWIREGKQVAPSKS
jgi:hypothetical protein